MAAPACNGQAHTLPEGSAALLRYPCGGSGLQRLLYILRQARAVLWDIFHLKPGDAWVTYTSWAAGLRFASALLLPTGLHTQVVAPAMVYYLRAAAVAHHLLMGPAHQPSPLSLRALSTTALAYDVGFSATLFGIWRVRPLLELAHCLFMTSGMLVLIAWHHDRLLAGTNVAWLMATRLAVPCIVMYLDALVSHWRYGADQHRPRRLAAVSNGSDDGDVAGRGGAQPRQQGSGKKDPAEDTTDAGSGDSAAGTGANGHRAQGCGQPPASNGPSGPSSTGGHRPSLSELRQQQEQDQQQQQQRPLGSRGTGSVSTHRAATVSAAPGGAEEAHGAVAGADAGADPAPVAAPGGGQREAQDAPPPPELPLYQPFLQRSTLHFKIPGVEPEQLGPGYQQRLRELSAARGYHLTAVYVRRGCVELTLVLEEERRRPGARMGVSSPSSRAAQPPRLGVEHVVRALCLESHLQAAAPAAGNTGVDKGAPLAPASPDSHERSPSWMSAVRVRALDGAVPPPVGPAGDVGGLEQADQDPDSSHRCRTGWSDGTPGGGGGGGRKFRVLSAWPRVLLLRPSGSRLPVAELRIVVAWDTDGGTSVMKTHGSAATKSSGAMPAAARAGAGAKETASDLRVEVRDDSGATLPARVVGRGATPADTAAAADGGGSSHKYDVQLLQMPDRPGTLELELSLSDSDGGDGSCAAAAAGAGAPAQVGLPYSVVLPLLLVDDAGVAAELAAAAATEGCRESSTADGRLDDLLYDVGSWAAAVSEAEVAAAAGAPHGVAGAPDDGGTEVAVDPDDLLALGTGRPAAPLGAHLLRYAGAAGWRATAEWIAGGLRRLGSSTSADAGSGGDGGADAPPEGGGLNAGAAERAPALRSPPVKTVSRSRAATSSAVATALDPESCASEKGDSGSAGGGRGAGSCPEGPPGPSALSSSSSAPWDRRGSPWLRALGWVLQRQLVASPSPAEAAALRPLKEQWVLQMTKILVLIEALMMLAVLMREAHSGGAQLSRRACLVFSFLGMGSGLAAARLVLPNAAWERLALRARLARYGCLLLFKSVLAAAASVAVPVVVGRHAAAVRFLLYEGVIVPGACLLSPRAAAMVAAVTLPLDMRLMRASGIAGGIGGAVLLAASAAAAAVATSLCCHAHLQRTLEARAGGAPAAGSGATAAAAALARKDAAAGSAAGVMDCPIESPAAGTSDSSSGGGLCRARG